MEAGAPCFLLPRVERTNEYNPAVTMSMIFDEYGRPFIILREQQAQARIRGKEAQKVRTFKSLNRKLAVGWWCCVCSSLPCLCAPGAVSLHGGKDKTMAPYNRTSTSTPLRSAATAVFYFRKRTIWVRKSKTLFCHFGQGSKISQRGRERRPFTVRASFVRVVSEIDTLYSTPRTHQQQYLLSQLFVAHQPRARVCLWPKESLSYSIL